MRTLPARLIATIAMAVTLVPGCTQPGPLAGRGSMMGTLRTSVASLQHENEQLKREIADLQVENRRVVDRLDEADETNGVLTAKLNDARAAIRGEGSSTLADTAPAPRRDERRMAPAGRSSRPARRPPFARIPGRIEDAPADDLDGAEDDRSAPRSREDLGPQSRLDRPSRWLPVGSDERALR